MSEKELIKVLFHYHSSVLDEEVAEIMWAIPVDIANGICQLDSIPFYGPPIASDDIFYAEYNEEEVLTFREVREHSGNSILQVLMMQRPYDTWALREKIKALGCLSESINDRYFVAEVPASVDYRPVQTLLSELEASAQIGYAEPVLSYRHSY